MKKLVTILFSLISISLYAQLEGQEKNLKNIRTIDWKFIVEDIEYVNDSTWVVGAIPYDMNDPGAELRLIGDFIRDNESNVFKVIGSTQTTLTVEDLQFDGMPTAPQQDRIARCYLPLNEGDSLFYAAGGTNDFQLDDASKWKNQAVNDELLAQAISYVWAYMHPFEFIDFDTTIANPEYQKGRLFWDSTKVALSYYNDINGVTVNLSQEVIFRVYNGGVDTIFNGKIVSPDVNTVITLADNREKDKAIIIAVATHDIPPGTWGWVTKIGQVGGLNTSGFIEGQKLYLGQNGDFTDIPPEGGSYRNIVGVVDVVDSELGIITVDIIPTELTVEITDTNGFPEDQRFGSTLSVNNLTREFSITPVGSGYHYYVRGLKYEQTSTKTVTFNDIEGQHWFYFDRDTLKVIANPTTFQKRDVILNDAFVSYIYWNATDDKYVYDILDERHGISMSPVTHAYLHLTRGAQYISGFAVNDILADELGSLDAHAQFSVSQGTFADEDMFHTSTNFNVGETMQVTYRIGGDGDSRVDTLSGFSVLTTGTGRLAYNEYTGTTWQISEVPNGNYVLYHIFGVNGINDKLVSVMGQNVYLTISAARDAASQEISNIVTNFDAEESIPIATIIFETRDVYTNSVNARIRTTDEGADYIDWRTTELAQGVTPSSHSNLTELYKAGIGVNWGHIDDQPQDIYGDKNFIEGLRFNGDTVATLKNLNDLMIDNEAQEFFRSGELSAVTGGDKSIIFSRPFPDTDYVVFADAIYTNNRKQDLLTSNKTVNGFTVKNVLGPSDIGYFAVRHVDSLLLLVENLVTRIYNLDITGADGLNYSGDTLYLVAGDSILDFVTIVSSGGGVNVFKYESALLEDQNIVDIGSDITSSTLFFINGYVVNNFTYIGSEVTLNMDISIDDYLIAVSVGDTPLYNYILTNNETSITLPVAISGTSLIFYNGVLLNSSQYSGSIDLNLDVQQSDNLIVKQ